MSSYADVVDAVVEDMRSNVFAVVLPQNIWRYSPLLTDAVQNDDERHLGCWLVPDGAETIAPLTIGSFGGSGMGTQVFSLVYWEPATDDELEGQRIDPSKAQRLFELSDEVKARFYTTATLHLGGSFRVEYLGIAAWGLGHGIRFMGWTFSAQRPIDFTP